MERLTTSFAEGPKGRLLAALVAHPDPGARAQALEDLATTGGASLSLLLETALVDVVRDAPGLLPAIAAKLAARADEPAARRALDLLARFTGSDEVRALALRAVRGEGDTAEAAFVAKLDAFLARLPASPLVEKLRGPSGVEAIARAFASTWELARATNDAALVDAARALVAPLEAVGLQAVLEPDPTAFDVRPGARDEVARPAVRRGAVVLVRGVALQAAPAAAAVEKSSELATALRRALAEPTAAAREEALLALVDALARRAEGEAPPPEAAALADELARGGAWADDVRAKARVARGLGALGRQQC